MVPSLSCCPRACTPRRAPQHPLSSLGSLAGLGVGSIVGAHPAWGCAELAQLGQLAPPLAVVHGAQGLKGVGVASGSEWGVRGRGQGDEMSGAAAGGLACGRAGGRVCGDPHPRVTKLPTSTPGNPNMCCAVGGGLEWALLRHIRQQPVNSPSAHARCHHRPLPTAECAAAPRLPLAPLRALGCTPHTPGRCSSRRCRRWGRHARSWASAQFGAPPPPPTLPPTCGSHYSVGAWRHSALQQLACTPTPHAAAQRRSPLPHSPRLQQCWRQRRRWRWRQEGARRRRQRRRCRCGARWWRTCCCSV